jgi:hypothetical protein
MNKKQLLLGSLLCLMLASFTFKSLHSTTYIKAHDAFVLGNNEHGKFHVRVTNTSKFELTIWQYPIAGGRHSPLTLKPSATAKVDVDRNTGIHIENNSNEEVAVKLKVRGDVGLSMGYKNQ